MINRDEIEAKSKEFEIHVANVERDYVFGWLLFGIFTASSLKDEIFLKGGNALRKGYFENTRFSSDLDFGIPGDIDQSVLLGEINKVCDFIQERAGVTFLKGDNKIEEKFSASEAPIPGLRVYEARIYFNDFYGKRDDLRIKISMDITRFDKVLLDIQKVALIHPYSDAAQVVCEIRCMKLEEIIATKLKCLLQRQHAPDLFDYSYSIKLLGGNPPCRCPVRLRPLPDSTENKSPPAGKTPGVVATDWSDARTRRQSALPQGIFKFSNGIPAFRPLIVSLLLGQAFRK